jgi:hypothetical protein
MVWTSPSERSLTDQRLIIAMIETGSIQVVSFGRGP